MSAILIYLKTNIANLVGVLFVILALFFGARFEPLKEPTITLITGIINVLVPEETEVKAVEIAPNEPVIVPTNDIVE